MFLTVLQLDLEDTMAFMLSLLGLVAIVVLIILISKLIRLVSKASTLLDELSPSLKGSLDKLPPIMEDVKGISGNVLDLTDDVTEEVGEILHDVSTVTGGVKDAFVKIGECFSPKRKVVADRLGSLLGHASKTYKLFHFAKNILADKKLKKSKVRRK